MYYVQQSCGACGMCTADVACYSAAGSGLQLPAAQLFHCCVSQLTWIDTLPTALVAFGQRALSACPFAYYA
jgi:hypothetical protein